MNIQKDISEIVNWKTRMQQALLGIGIDVSNLPLSEWGKKISDTPVKLPDEPKVQI